MKLFGMLRRPGWESRDPAERARAIAQETDSELAAKLPEFARNDDSPLVRAAAVRKLRDLSLLGDRARHDRDAKVRDDARERVLALLTGDELPLAERERFVRVEDDQDWLVAIAQRSPSPELRRVALERISRPAFIADRCTRDPDAGIRAWLLGRIDQVAALQRIAEGARKSDKQLARAARDRADALRRESGDPVALRERALDLCELFDRLRRERPADVAARADALRAEWATLRDRVGDVLARRVDGYVDALDRALDPAAYARVPEPAPTPPTILEREEALADVTPAEPAAPDAAPEPGLASTTPAEPDAGLAALADEIEQRRETIKRESMQALRRRFEKRASEVGAAAATDPARVRFEAAAALVAARHDDEAARSKQHEATIATQLGVLEHATEAGQLGAARAAHQAIAVAVDALTQPLSPALQARRAQADVALDKLANWQRWSNNKVRQRLCDEIEALQGAGLHPDAVANKVRDAQAEWARLDALEGLTAENAGESGLARRFRGLGHRVLAPARQYFEKRRELRAGKKDDVDAVVARATELLAGGDADPRRLSSARGEVVERLRLLDELDPRARAAIGKRLRELLTQLDARRDALRGDAEAEKRKVIANLKRKLAQADLPEALRLARDAQAHWQTLPRLGRKDDDALYAELREVVDPYFQRADAERSAQDATRAQAAGEAQAVLDELTELARGDAEALRHADARLAALATRWRALAPTPEAGEESDARPARGERRDARGAGRPGAGGGRDGRDARGGRDDRDRERAPRRRDHPREREYDRAVSQVQEALAAAKRERRQAARDNALAAVDALHALEAREMAGTSDGPAAREEQRARLAALDLDGPVRHALEARLDAFPQALSKRQSAADASGWLAENAALADRLAVRAECAAGIDSPASSQALRREHQVKRLAQRMGGGAGEDESAHGVLLAWIALAPLSADAHRDAATRLRAALAQLA